MRRMAPIQRKPGEGHELARREVRPEALDRCIAALHDRGLLRDHEPGALRYEVWQDATYPMRFVHIFVWKDAEGNRLRGESAAVKKFAGVLYPNCVELVEFVEYTQTDANAAFRRSATY